MEKTCSKIVPSLLGPLRIVATDDALVALVLPTETNAVPSPTRGRHDVLDAAARELAEYFAGTRRTFTVPLAPAGTAFQKAVWRALGEIPFGEVRTYSDVARAIGAPRAVRAVGAANGKNPIAIVVPCHRVIGANGALTGYAGGLAIKKWLLDHEAETAGVQRPGPSAARSASAPRFAFQTGLP